MTPAPSDYTVAPSDLRYLPTAPIIAQRGGDSPTNQPLCEESGTGDRARGNRGKGTNWDRMEKGGGNLCAFFVMHGWGWGGVKGRWSMRGPQMTAGQQRMADS